MRTKTTTRPDTGRQTSRQTMVPTGAWVADGNVTVSRLRGSGRRRSVPHLLLGSLLVVACTAGFLLVLLNSGDREPVLALARPVTVGQVLTAQDLRQVAIATEPGVSVVGAGQASAVVGRTMSTSLPAGALLTAEAVGGSRSVPAGQAVAALSLKAGQFPPEVSPGTRVSVVFVPGPAGGVVASSPVLETPTVWPAMVLAVTWPPNEQVAVMSVQLDESAAGQVAAVPPGQLSIVMVSKGDR